MTSRNSRSSSSSDSDEDMSQLDQELNLDARSSTDGISPKASNSLENTSFFNRSVQSEPGQSSNGGFPILRAALQSVDSSRKRSAERMQSSQSSKTDGGVPSSNAASTSGHKRPNLNHESSKRTDRGKKQETMPRNMSTELSVLPAVQLPHPPDPLPAPNVETIEEKNHVTSQRTARVVRGRTNREVTYEARSHETDQHEARSHETDQHEARSHETDQHEARGHETNQHEARSHETNQHEAQDCTAEHGSFQCESDLRLEHAQHSCPECSRLWMMQQAENRCLQCQRPLCPEHADHHHCNPCLICREPLHAGPVGNTDVCVQCGGQVCSECCEERHED